MWRRRDFIVNTTAIAAAGIQTPAIAAGAPKTILVLGDSLSAEYGLRRGTGWVALMSERLQKRNTATTVVNASISGDSTSGGRSRLSALLQRHRPEAVIIELGANDALRGLPLAQTRDNLRAMTQAAKNSGARVLLIGMQVPPNYGREYNQRFAEVFSEVARSEGSALVPFMLKGVADIPDARRLFQSDQIHPNESAHPIILETIWAELEAWLR